MLLVVKRGRRTVKLDWPDAAAESPAPLGLSFAAAAPAVRSVAPDSPAAAAGIVTGDVIVLVAGTPVADAESATRAIELDASDAVAYALRAIAILRARKFERYPDALADGLLELLRNPDRAAALGAAGAAGVREYYHVGRMAEAAEGVYRELQRPRTLN